MLTDIFAYRYKDVALFKELRNEDKAFLVSVFDQLKKEVVPFYGYKGQKLDGAEGRWQSPHDKLCRELGMRSLASLYVGQHRRNILYVCEAFLTGFDPKLEVKKTPDRYIKERLSFIELAFRESEVRHERKLSYLDRRISSSILDVSDLKQETIETFQDSIKELNERMRRAGYKLHYHNGFIQISDDTLIESQVETPFWQLVSGPEWKNVDHEMKEALDLRDSGKGDPAFHAAKALESTIKIIAKKKGAITGKERGAANFIDSLKTANVINQWEQDFLKNFFKEVRNPQGHGAGADDKIELYKEQIDWAIEHCMSWSKSLIKRS